MENDKYDVKQAFDHAVIDLKKSTSSIKGYWYGKLYRMEFLLIFCWLFFNFVYQEMN